jgi:hypothetical protein
LSFDNDPQPLLKRLGIFLRLRILIPGFTKTAAANHQVSGCASVIRKIGI